MRRLAAALKAGASSRTPKSQTKPRRHLSRPKQFQETLKLRRLFELHTLIGNHIPQRLRSHMDMRRNLDLRISLKQTSRHPPQRPSSQRIRHRATTSRTKIGSIPGITHKRSNEFMPTNPSKLSLRNQKRRVRRRTRHLPALRTVALINIRQRPRKFKFDLPTKALAIHANHLTRPTSQANPPLPQAGEGRGEGTTHA